MHDWGAQKPWEALETVCVSRKVSRSDALCFDSDDANYLWLSIREHVIWNINIPFARGPISSSGLVLQKPTI
jgi:hypothetical protein